MQMRQSRNVFNLALLIFATACGGSSTIDPGSNTSSSTGNGGESASSTSTSSTSSTTTTSTSTGNGGAGGQNEGGGGAGQGGAGGEVPYTELAVVEAIDSPAGGTLSYNSFSAPMLKVNFIALGNHTMDGLKLTHIGSGPAADVSEVMITNNHLEHFPCAYDGQTGVADCSGLSYTIPDGTTGYGVFNVSFESAQKGLTHGWSIAAPSAVTLAGTGVVTGNFPLDGNLFVVN